MLILNRIFLLIILILNYSYSDVRFFVTPSDSVAIIAANAVQAIPYFSGGLKGVARFCSCFYLPCLSSLMLLVHSCMPLHLFLPVSTEHEVFISQFFLLKFSSFKGWNLNIFHFSLQEHAHFSCSGCCS